MPDAGFHKCGTTEVEVIQTNASVSTNLSVEFDMKGAERLIIMEELEATDNPTLTDVGTDFLGGNVIDKDFATTEAESGTDTDEGIVDFGSIAVRDFGVFYNILFGGSDNADVTIDISDDDITYVNLYSFTHGNSPATEGDFHPIFHNESFRYVRFHVAPHPAEAHNTLIYEIYATAIGELVLEIKETDSSEWRPLITFPQLPTGLFGTIATRISQIGSDIIDDAITNYQRILTSSSSPKLLRFTATQGTRKHQIVIHKVNTCRG